MYYVIPERLLEQWLHLHEPGLHPLRGNLLWLCREAMWWWIIAVLSALLARFAIGTRVARTLAGAIGIAPR